MEEITSTFPWVLYLSITALAIGFLGIILQAREKKTLGITCTAIILIINLASALIEKYDMNSQAKAKNDYTTFIKGTSEIPALTASIFPLDDSAGKDVSIVFLLTNTDNLYPLRNVKVKFMQDEIKIGILNPGALTNIFELKKHKKGLKGLKDIDYGFSVSGYSVKKFTANFLFGYDENGNLMIDTKYMDANQKEFIPDWLKRTKAYNPKDSTVRPYDSMEIQPTK
jgi:hypothetical protein